MGCCSFTSIKEADERSRIQLGLKPAQIAVLACLKGEVKHMR